MASIYLSDLSEMLGVKDNTIRSWCRKARSARSMMDSLGQSSADLPAGYLPETLWPQTAGGRKMLFWEPAQVEGLRRFAEESRGRWGGKPKTPEEDDYTAFADFMELQELDDVALDAFGFSTRVINALEYNSITSVYHLAQLSKAELRELHNFGQKSIEDVRSKVTAYLENADAPTEEARPDVS